MVESNNAINNTVGASISGVTNTFTVTNPSNTASSAARTTISVGGASSADPSLNFNVSGATDWEMGIDNNDADKIKISQGTALGTNDTWIMTVAGERTMPLQPAFLAGAGSVQNNVTGDGTKYIVDFTSVQFDRNSDYDGTNTFTAPVDGRYFFYASMTYTNFSSSANNVNTFFLINSVEDQGTTYGNAGAISANASISTQISGFFELNALDTVQIQTQVNGGSKIVDILNSTAETKFSGFLVC